MLPPRSSARRLARETLLVTAGQFAGLGIGLLGTVLVTRALGPEGRGVYAWLVTLATIGIQVALLAPPALVRRLANRREPRLAATLLALCFAGTALTAPLVAFILLDRDLGPAARPYLPAAWLAVPITAGSLALFSLLQNAGRAGPVLLVQVLPRTVQLLAVALLFVSGRLDLRAAFGLFLFTAVVTLGLTLACLRPGAVRPDPALARELAGHLGLGWVAGLALFCTPRVSLLVLGAGAPTETVGQYGLALALQEAALAAPVALGGALIAHLSLRGEPDRRTAIRSALLVLGLAAVGCAAGALLSPALVPLVFGAAFAPAASAFVGLVAGIWLATLYWLAYPVLLARGRPAAIAAPALAALAAATATALLAVPRLGMDGAVLSNLAGFAVLAVSAAALAAGPPPAPARDALP